MGYKFEPTNHKAHGYCLEWEEGDPNSTNPMAYQWAHIVDFEGRPTLEDVKKVVADWEDRQAYALEITIELNREAAAAELAAARRDPSGM